MENDFNRKNHWENIYETKTLKEVSWYQPTPETSLEFIQKMKLSKDAAIIDIGGGDSFLVDHLLDLGFSNISVLDISEKAIERAQKRLGTKAGLVKWIITDITEFKTKEKYGFWHDRAAFHFLTNQEDVKKYIEIAENSLNQNGVLFIGTFSENGPKKCSGIEIKQYSEESLKAIFQNSFSPIESFTIDHKTPFDTIQNFLFYGFRKIS